MNSYSPTRKKYRLLIQPILFNCSFLFHCFGFYFLTVLVFMFSPQLFSCALICIPLKNVFKSFPYLNPIYNIFSIAFYTSILYYLFSILFYLPFSIPDTLSYLNMETLILKKKKWKDMFTNWCSSGPVSEPHRGKS